MKAVIAAVLFSASGLIAWGAEPTTPPEGFQSIFNGKDLSNWDGNPAYWSVKDGCLTGVTDGSLKHNRFIVWRDGVLKNFELRVKVRLPTVHGEQLLDRFRRVQKLGRSSLHGVCIQRIIDSGKHHNSNAATEAL